jgi:Xaa-Pro aminopeptidase
MTYSKKLDKTMERLLLLSQEEANLRLAKIKSSLEAVQCDSALFSENSSLYYLCGRVFAGYVFIHKDMSQPIYFIRRPVELTGENVVYIRKPENILEHLTANKDSVPAIERIGLELDSLAYSTAMRLAGAFGGTPFGNISPALKAARSVKTEQEINMMTRSGLKHERVYHKIPHLFKDGMSDHELEIEIEHLSRMEGCLGQFRISGSSMELYMGNILAGDNADNPSPYDFAMGGAGLDPSLPVGANGTLIRKGMTVMVDMNGNFNGYMTDMTRVFALGNINPLAQKAHQCSIEICEALSAMGTPGTPARDLYEKALEIVKAADLEDYYMGHRQHAGFIGHGVGIEINELPVIAPRSRDILAEGNTIALEPKFVIPGVGAVGIENTYVVTATGMKSLTNAPQEIIRFD